MVSKMVGASVKMHGKILTDLGICHRIASLQISYSVILTFISRSNILSLYICYKKCAKRANVHCRFASTRGDVDIVCFVCVCMCRCVCVCVCMWLRVCYRLDDMYIAFQSKRASGILRREK